MAKRNGHSNGKGSAAKQTPQMMITSAEEYLKIVEAEAPREAIPVPMPSGATFLLQVPDLTGYAMTGRMPQALTTQFLNKAEERGLKTLNDIKKNSDALVASVDVRDAAESLIFVRELVREAVVLPKFGDGPGEIPYEKFKTEDFKYVFQWVLEHSGVAGLQGLQTFRPRRERRALKSRANRQKLRRKAVDNPGH